MKTSASSADCYFYTYGATWNETLASKSFAQGAFWLSFDDFSKKWADLKKKKVSSSTLQNISDAV